MDSEGEQGGARTLDELLTTMETSLAGDASDFNFISGLESIQKQVSIASNVSSSAIPYRTIRDIIRQILGSSVLNSATLLEASSAFVAVVKAIPIMYDELIIATCFQKVVKILKDDVSKSDARCDRNGLLCCPDVQIPVQSYSKFWLALISLIDDPSFHIESPGFLDISVNALADLIGHAKGIWHQNLATDAFTSILRRIDVQTHSIIYRALFPLFRGALPAANRDSLVKTLEAMGKHELLQPKAAETSETDAHSSPAHGRRSVDNHCNRISNPTADKEKSKVQLLCFLELCCLRVPDKADHRAWLATVLVRVLLSLQDTQRQLFISFLLKISEHPKARVRLFAVEISPKFIFMSPASDPGLASDTLLWIRMLATRSNDRVPSIRARALSSMAEVLNSFGKLHTSTDTLNQLFSIAFSLRRRLRDPKARVRKSAVDFIGLSARLMINQGGDSPTAQHSDSDADCRAGQRILAQENVLKLYSLFADRCDDAVSTVRIASTIQATEIILNFPDGCGDKFCRRLTSVWCGTVLQHVNDTDNRCKETCLKALKAVLNPRRGGPGHGLGDSRFEASSRSFEMFPDLILEELGNGNRNLAELLRSAVSMLFRSGSFDGKSIGYLCEKIFSPSASNESVSHVQRGSWIALAEVAACGMVGAIHESSGFQPIIRHAVVFKNCNACKIAKAMAKEVPRESAETWAKQLIEEIAGSSKSDNGVTQEWLSSATSLLASLEPNRGNDILDECNRRIINSGEVTAGAVEHLLVVIGSVCMSFQLRTKPPQHLLTFVCALTSNGTKYPELRALALTTLGKMCLCHGAKPVQIEAQSGSEESRLFHKLGEDITRRNISIFVHELENATSSASRNNAVLILCDLCRLYTAVVEPYIVRMANLLSDPSEFVRTQVLSSLVALLQEDFIKVRGGPVLYQIGDCLLDPCGSVSSTAEYCLLHVISQKNSSVLATSFIELIFVLNDCNGCHFHNHNRTSARGRRFQSIDFQDFDKRLIIYDVFLRGMTLEQKLRLPSRFRTDVIGLIVDEKLDITKTSVQAVLSDILQLLCNARLRSVTAPKPLQDTTNLGSQVNDLSQREEAAVGSLQMNKKMSLLAKVQMLELRETTMPALLEIRHRLEQMRSPLLRTLMRCFCTLLQPHRKDMENVIRDPVVRSEIVHEMTSSATRDVRANKIDKGGVDTGDSEPSTVKRRRSDKSPADVKVMSVPQRRKVRKVRKLEFDESDGEEEVVAELTGEKNALMQRIVASPKLGTIARRTRRARTFDVNANENSCDFAAALERIEDDGEEPKPFEPFRQL